MTAASLIRRATLTAAICATAIGAGIAAPQSAQAAAAPYITTPGVHAYYAGNVAVFTAHIQCSDWKGIAALKVGTQGVRVLTRALYICENGGSTNVRFTISGDQLPVTASTSTPSSSAATTPTATSPAGRTASPASSPSTRPARARRHAGTPSVGVPAPLS